MDARLSAAEKTTNPQELREHLVVLSSQIGYMLREQHLKYLNLCSKLQGLIHTVMPSYDGNNH